MREGCEITSSTQAQLRAGCNTTLPDLLCLTKLSPPSLKRHTALQNAYTSTDETVYQLTVPSDSPQLLDEAISVLAEFAFKIRCGESVVQSVGPVHALKLTRGF